MLKFQAVGRRRFIGLAGGLAVALTMSGNAMAQDPVQVKIGVPGSLSGIAARYAAEKGYFKEAGIDAVIIILTAGSAAVPQLLGGQLNFAAIDSVVTMTARSKNIPLVMTAPNTMGIENPDRGYGNIVVGDPSKVKSLQDLASGTVAVNQLGGTAWALARATLDNAGVDSTKVKFIEVPPPQLMAALEQGLANAAVLPEPFTSVAVSKGMGVLTNVEATTVVGQHTFTFDSAQDWATANADIVNKFNEVMLRANAELNNDRALTLSVAERLTKIDRKLLEGAVLPNFGTKPVTVEGLSGIRDLAVKYKILDAKAMPDLSSIIFKAAAN